MMRFSLRRTPIAGVWLITEPFFVLASKTRSPSWTLNFRVAANFCASAIDLPVSVGTKWVGVRRATAMPTTPAATATSTTRAASRLKMPRFSGLSSAPVLPWSLVGFVSPFAALRDARSCFLSRTIGSTTGTASPDSATRSSSVMSNTPPRRARSFAIDSVGNTDAASVTAGVSTAVVASTVGSDSSSPTWRVGSRSSIGRRAASREPSNGNDSGRGMVRAIDSSNRTSPAASTRSSGSIIPAASTTGPSASSSGGALSEPSSRASA